MRKSFATSIDEKIQVEFKEKCKTSNINMNDVLECLMRSYIKGDIIVKPSFDVDYVKK